MPFGALSRASEILTPILEATPLTGHHTNVVSNANRARIIELHKQHRKPKAIQQSIHPPIKIDTIQSIIKKWKKSGEIEHGKHTGRKRKCEESVAAAITGIQSAHNDWTLAAVVDELKQQNNVSIKKSTVWQTLKSAGFTTKILRRTPEARFSTETLIKRHIYAENKILISSAERELEISIDEAGAAVGHSRTRGRSKRGVNAVKAVPVLNGPRMNIIAAISPIYGLFYFEKRTETTNGENFRDFLENMHRNTPQLQQQGHIFVMDNAPPHIAKCVDEWFSMTHHKKELLPPYSPMLNPIEECFSKWKGLIKKENPGDEEDIAIAIDQCSAEISIDNCKQWFKHSTELLDNCLNMQQM